MRPELLILVNTSQSMGKAGSGGGGTRLEEVLDALQKGAMAESLLKTYDLRWFTFDRTASPLDKDDLAKLNAKGTTTQFAESITAASGYVRGLGGNPQRLLLVSDGNDLGQADPALAARRFGLTIDVLAPRPSKQTESAAFAIAEVQGARRVLLGSETHFRVTLSSKQPASQDQNLVLLVTENGKKLLEQPLVVKAGRAEERVILAHRPTAAGLQQYEFKFSLGTEQLGKSYPLPVQVLDNKYEVLILEDTWRWEYKYLHRLFEDDPSFRFSALLARGGGGVVQLRLARSARQPDRLSAEPRRSRGL